MASRSFEVLFKIIAGCVLIVSFVFAVKAYTVDSELWSVSLARFLFDPSSNHAGVYSKPLFHLILDTLFLIPLSSFEHVLVAKVLFAFNAVALAYFSFRTYAAVSKRSSPRVVVWFSFLILITNPLWLAESFRIRADLLAMTFTMASLAFAFSRDEDDRLQVLVSPRVVLLMMASLLATPKSLVWNLPLMGYACFQMRGQFAIRWNRKFLWYAAAAVLLCVGLALFGPVLEGYMAAWRHFVRGVERASALGKAPWIVDWFFMLDSLKAMPLYWLLFLIGLLAAPVLLKREGRKAEFHLVMALWVFVLGFTLYSPKLYFFLAACLPLFALSLVFLFESLRIKPVALMAWAAAPLISFGCWSWFLFPMHEGVSTYQLIDDLEHFLERQPARIFDSMGLLPRGDNVLAYFSEADPVSNAWSVYRVIYGRPDFIFQTARLKTFWTRLQPALLDPDYVEVQSGFWISRSNATLLAASEKIGGQITHVHEPTELFGQRLHCLAVSTTPYMRWDFSGLNCF